MITMPLDSTPNQNLNNYLSPTPKSKFPKTKLVMVVAIVTAVIVGGLASWIIQQGKVNDLKASNKQLQAKADKYDAIVKIVDEASTNLNELPEKARNIERQ